MPSIIASKEFIKEFFKDPVKGMLFACIIAISTLFGLLYKNQESEKTDLKTQNTKCETKNYLQDVDIKILLAGKAKSDSLLNRIMGKVEALEELKKQRNEISSVSRSGDNVVQ